MRCWRCTALSSRRRLRLCARRDRARNRRSCRSRIYGRPFSRRRAAPWLPSGTLPNMAIEIVTGPGVRTVSPPNSGHENSTASPRKPLAKSPSQASSISFGSASDNRNPSGRAPLAAKIGKVHAQGFARHRMRGVVGEKMHAADNGVGLEHQIAAGRRLDEGSVVAKTKRAGMRRDRREEFRDQAIFGGDVIRSRNSSWAPPQARPQIPPRAICAPIGPEPH